MSGRTERRRASAGRRAGVSGRLAIVAAAAALAAAALVPVSGAQETPPAAAPHLAASASGALLQTPPADPRAAGAPGWPLPADPREVATSAEASTTGFDGDAVASRARASAGPASAARRAGDGSAAASAGDAARGPFASALALPVDAAAGACPPAGADGERVVSDGLAQLDAGADLGQVALGRGASTRSTVALVPVAGQDGLAVRSTASAEVVSLRVGGYELRVVRQPRLVAEASGADGGAAVRWTAPVIDVVDVASGDSVARLDESHASFTAPDESDFGGRNQPFRASLVAPYERIESPDGGFARGRAALVRIRFQPSLELGELTVGALEASATAPVGGVTTCDGGAPVAQERSRPHVLVYEGNNGFEHVSRHEANRVIGRLANESGAFSVEITDQATFLRDDRLAGVSLVMFNNNVGNMPVDQGQRDALERYLLAGGGAGGIHSATDANYEWDEYGEMFGARFDGHPHMGYMPEWGKARVVVEDQSSPITSGWHGQESFEWADEYYRWREQDVPALRADPDVNVLLSLDTDTVHPGTQRGINPYGAYRVRFQPIAWTKTFRGAGRVFYTNMGHNGFAWAHPEFRTMALEGIRWAARAP